MKRRPAPDNTVPSSCMVSGQWRARLLPVGGVRKKTIAFAVNQAASPSAISALIERRRLKTSGCFSTSSSSNQPSRFLANTASRANVVGGDQSNGETAARNSDFIAVEQLCYCCRIGFGFFQYRWGQPALSGRPEDGGRRAVSRCRLTQAATSVLMSPSNFGRSATTDHSSATGEPGHAGPFGITAAAICFYRSRGAPKR